MINAPAYSNLFPCVYDQPEAVGRLGRGAHYSIFRSTQWRGISGEELEGARIHDFAIIWDEDHDRRVVRVIERLHLAGLLWPIVFIGERKGILTILFSQLAGPLQGTGENHIERITEITQEADDIDNWTLEYGWFQRVEVPEEGTSYTGSGIVNDVDWRVAAYLQGIDAIWLLGEKN